MFNGACDRVVSFRRNKRKTKRKEITGSRDHYPVQRDYILLRCVNALKRNSMNLSVHALKYFATLSLLVGLLR